MDACIYISEMNKNCIIYLFNRFLFKRSHAKSLRYNKKEILVYGNITRKSRNVCNHENITNTLYGYLQKANIFMISVFSKETCDKKKKTWIFLKFSIFNTEKMVRYSSIFVYPPLLFVVFLDIIF